MPVCGRHLSNGWGGLDWCMESVAILAGGCFWCLEAVYQRVDGVVSVQSGYTGGHVESPDYESVCSGSTGHAEAVRIVFDSDVVGYRELLDLFWRAHDPTTLNRQGADVGTQYRSAIFYLDAEQKREAEESMARVQGELDALIVTEIAEAGEFFPAEDCHDDYYNRHRGAMYCQAVIRPKLAKLGMPE